MTRAELLALLDGDREALEMLLVEGLLPGPAERHYSEEEVELARVARVLLRDLEVNPAGVQVILHMRRQIVELRLQMVRVLHELSKPRST